MSLAPSNRQMNWLAVSWTPVGGTLTTINGVTNIAIDQGGSIAKFAGDGDRYNSTVVNDFNEPTIAITTGNQQVINTIPTGSRGTFQGTHGDAVNQAAPGGGGIVYTCANSVVQNRTTGGQHRQFGEGQLMLIAWAPDGYTNPISTSAA